MSFHNAPVAKGLSSRVQQNNDATNQYAGLMMFVGGSTLLCAMFDIKHYLQLQVRTLVAFDQRMAILTEAYS